MVCFSEMHPDPTSQPDVFTRISFLLPPPPHWYLPPDVEQGEDSWRLRRMSLAAVNVLRTSQKSCKAESDAFLTQYLYPGCVIIYLFLSLPAYFHAIQKL